MEWDYSIPVLYFHLSTSASSVKSEAASCDLVTVQYDLEYICTFVHVSSAFEAFVVHMWGKDQRTTELIALLICHFSSGGSVN